MQPGLSGRGGEVERAASSAASVARVEKVLG